MNPITRFGCYLFASLSTLSAFSAPPTKETPTQAALLTEITGSEKRQSELLANMLTLYQKIAEISAKAPNKKEPIGDQLSQSDLDTFNLLSAQVRYLLNQTGVETSKQNTLWVLYYIYEASQFMTKIQIQYLAEKSSMNGADFEKYLTIEAAKIPAMTEKLQILIAAKEHFMDSKLAKAGP